MKIVFIITAAALAGCGGNDQLAQPDGTLTTLTNAKDVPIDGLSSTDVAKFRKGDDLFDVPFREVDGLGPLFIRSSCGACHSNGLRGPGLVQKMAVVTADGITASADQSELPFGHTLRQGLAAGATTPITALMASDVKVSIRIGPPVLGRGYIEAVDDSEILRVAAEQAQRTDAIHGKVARVTFTSVPSGDGFSTYQTNDAVIGRFALKARIATLDDFSADAFQGDMGLTTPMRPTELLNPDGLTDDADPGVDLDQEHIDRVTFYVRRIAIPQRVGMTAAGAKLFDQVQCSGCHVATMHTRKDFPIAQLADIDAPIYTDLLLHDMGDDLADGMVDGGADSRGWRTAPLIGLRFNTLFLHDGRASSVTGAITAHAGEAQAAAEAFAALSQTDRDTLVAFVEAL